jgi:hypothetical protein
MIGAADTCRLAPGLDLGRLSAVPPSALVEYLSFGWSTSKVTEDGLYSGSTLKLVIGLFGSDYSLPRVWILGYSSELRDMTSSANTCHAALGLGLDRLLAGSLSGWSAS